MSPDATVFAGPNCVLIETPRRSMTKLINSVDAVKKLVDRTFVERAIRARFGDDARFIHPFRQQTLPQRVIDFVRARVV